MCFGTLHSGLVAVLADFLSNGSARAFEFPVKVGQLIDSIGSADLSVLFLAQPRKSLLKQLKHPLDKGQGRAILFGHKITSIFRNGNGMETAQEFLTQCCLLAHGMGLDGPVQSQPKRLSCTGVSIATGHGAGLICALTGSTM